MWRRIVFGLMVGLLAWTADGETLFHWTFDGGTVGESLYSDTDIASGWVAHRFTDDDGVGGATGLFYGQGNPTFNSSQTCADFQNDLSDNDCGYGLAVLDTGVDCPIDLSTVSEVTIEAFTQPYGKRQSIIIRKNNSPSDGGIYYIDTRPEGYFAVLR